MRNSLNPVYILQFVNILTTEPYTFRRQIYKTWV